MQDTVEKDVEGLAQQIILEDEERRAQELVSVPMSYTLELLLIKRKY